GDLDPTVNFVAGIRDDTSTRFSTNVNRQELFLGFELQWAIDDEPTQARVQQAKFDTVSIQLAAQKIRDNLRASARSQARFVETQRKLLQVGKERWEMAKQVVSAETIRYQRGQTDLDVLLRARQTEMES